MPELLAAGFDWLGEAPVRYDFYDKTVSVFYLDSAHSYIRYADGEEILIPGVTSAVKIIDKSAALTQWAANMACNHLRDKASFAAAMGSGWHDMCDLTFEQWLGEAKYAHKNYKEAAGDTGHRAHDWIEDFIKAAIRGDYDRMATLTDELPEDERARNGCYAALEWMAKHNVRWVHTERKIYSRQHDFAGTLDGLAYVSACGDKNCCGVYEDLTLVAATFCDVLAVIDWKTSNGLYPEYEYQTGAYTEAFNEEFNLGIAHRFIIRLGKEDGQFESRFLPPERLQDDVDIFLGCLALYRATERRNAADKAHKDAVKAAAKAAKEAAELAARERKAAYRQDLKAIKDDAKAVYKNLREGKVTVINAQASADDCLRRGMSSLALVYPEMFEEQLEIAA